MTDDQTQAGIRELFRYARAHEVRVYRLHLGEGRTELWRITECAGQAPVSIKETDFYSADEAVQFLEELVRTLVAGRWREC